MSPSATFCNVLLSTPQSIDEFYGFNYNAKNYISPGAADYPYYVRKHNPLHTEDYTIQHTVYSVLLGDTVPLKLRGTTDDTLYTHNSSLSTVQANWGLKSLGRGDTIAALSNVLSFIAAKTGYKNVQTVPGDVPQFNLMGVASGVLTSTAFTPFATPNLKVRCAGRSAVLTRPGLNTCLTSGSLSPPVNLELQNKATPWRMSARTTSGKEIIPCADVTCA
ncbi:hypothetical protein C8J57DRAFT_1733655 [Mycena rebaudengoi]|nr:hypothetical protein C8J57DRAFT_1733655 [Mycena rebaudengoi]